MRKIILLDVDGVLLPMDKPSGWRKASTINVDGINYAIDKRMDTWLGELSQKADIYWATSWEYQALNFEKQLGFETKGVLEFHSIHNFDYRWYKLAAIEDFCEQEREADIMLVDDNVAKELVEESEVVKSMMSENHFSILRPDSKTGLTKSDIKKILLWAEK